MKFIRNNSLNPYFNIALEEYCLENKVNEENFFIIWRNKPSIVVGRHQNIFQEIDYEYIKKENILVVRRISGGGTVYHDLGNVNYTFIFNRNDNDINYEIHNYKIMEALSILNINTSMSKRHDILLDDKKISGNAQRIHKKHVLHHGTILFDTDLVKLEKSLDVKNNAIYSKATKSVRSQVTNIKENMCEDMNTEEFQEHLIKILSNDYSDDEILLTDEDFFRINKKVNEKFMKWEWNYGESPKFTVNKHVDNDNDIWDVKIIVNNGLILECNLIKNGKEILYNLTGLRYEIDVLDANICGLTKNDIYCLFFKN